MDIAVSSAVLDQESAALFAEAGVTEYWIVLGLGKQIEVYRQPEGGVYLPKHLHSVGETLICESVPSV